MQQQQGAWKFRFRAPDPPCSPNLLCPPPPLVTHPCATRQAGWSEACGFFFFERSKTCFSSEPKPLIGQQKKKSPLSHGNNWKAGLRNYTVLHADAVANKTPVCGFFIIAGLRLELELCPEIACHRSPGGPPKQEIGGESVGQGAKGTTVGGRAGLR